MKRLVNLIFCSDNTSQSLMLLFGRVTFGFALLQHGLDKLYAFDVLTTTFPDPIGLGSVLSVCLAIFAEVFCSILLILGCLQRVVLLPIIATLSIAFFITHGGNTSEGELALIFLFAFIMLLIGGAGKYSIDHHLYTHLQSKP